MQKLPIIMVATGASVCVLVGSVTAQSGGRGKDPRAEAQKAVMDDMADAQEDLRDALATKDGEAVSVAALKIEGFMAKTESYWAAKRAADIVKLAQTSRALSKDVAAAGAANKILVAQAALEKLSANCNACHDLHPEKR